ncbi:MAG: Fic family protein [Dehalococcoidia bacterium]
MDPKDFDGTPAGIVRRHPLGYWTFIPNPLPPGLVLSEKLVNLLSDADRALGTLSGLGETLPNPHLLIVPFTRREAVLSSKIEGTLTSLSDLFRFEAVEDESLPGDVREVSNYVRAMEHGLARLPNLPLSTRLIRELHERLFRGVRREHLTPGEFRRSQNWIGPPGCTLDQATFVPPPVDEVLNLLDQWERFLHEASRFPPLIECAFMHYQFEAVHPFLDGNGRVGRLLITLYLCAGKYLSQPLLYLSAFFQRHRDEYYDRLLAVSQRGDWEGWLAFFLRGIAEQSRDAVARSRRIISLQQAYRDRLHEARASRSALHLVDVLFESPVLTIPVAATRIGVTYPTAAAALQRLARAGIVTELGPRRRGRIFFAEELVRTIEQDL